LESGNAAHLKAAFIIYCRYMKKLDWYILKKFLSTFFFAIFLFAVIAIVIDVSEKTDDFVRSGLGFKDIVTNYYFGFIPHIIALLLPLFVFLAVIFFTSKMAGHSEIIAICGWCNASDGTMVCQSICSTKSK